MNTSAWIEALGWTLIHFVWQGAVAGLCLWAVLQLASKARPQARYAAACVALLTAAGFAVATFAREIRASSNLANAGPRAETQTASTALPPTRGSAAPEFFPASATAPSPAEEPAGTAAAPLVQQAPRALSWERIHIAAQGAIPGIVCLWLIGVGFLSLRLWRSWRAVRRLRRSGHFASEALRGRFAVLRASLCASSAAELLVSTAARVPMVIGWLKPVVLLPASVLTGLSLAQVEAILAHELAHIRRHDYFVNLIQNVIETVFFYHPAVWWISAEIRREREHCCDELASAAAGGPLEYVRALAALEEARGAEPSLVLAATGGSLLSRARRLLDPGAAEGPGHGFLAGGLVVLLLLATMIPPVAMLRAADENRPAAASTAAEVSKDTPVRHEQTREVLKLWRGEYKDAEAVPAEAMRRVGKQVSKYIETSPGDNAEKFRTLLPQLEGEREWPWAEAAAMLDTLCDISTGPVGWTALTEQFRAFDRIKKGQAWTADALKAVPFGPANEQGLRAAWIFDPMQPSYAVGDVVKSRVLFHNSGKEPIEFRTDAWHQEDRWHVTNAAGNPVEVKTTWYTGLTPLQRFVVEPGQVVEVPGHGVGIGEGDYSEKYSVGAIGAEIPAKPGDELRCAWEVTFHPAGADPNAGAPSRLRTGEVKFRVTPKDPNDSKPPGVARGPGRYDLAPGVKLQASQVTSSKDGEGTTRVNTATILWFDEEGLNTAKHVLELPPGLGSYAIAWPRGGNAIWIATAKRAQKVDFSVPGQARAESWTWEDAGELGGIPVETRAALEKNRPQKANEVAKPVAPAAADATAKPMLPWRATGRVTDQDAKPLEGVEIWVHAGIGSLFRTGLAKTDADGRYAVDFGPGVMMKDSPQLQFANITAHKDGWFEKNLNRQGAGVAAMREVTPKDLEGYGETSAELTLPGKPREVNFVMAPAVNIQGRLVGTGSFPRLPPQHFRGTDEKPVAGHAVLRQSPLARWKVWLTGPTLPPATNVFASVETDADGRFEFRNVPWGYEWQIRADTHQTGKDPRSPLFTPLPETGLIVEVEMDETQSGLKFLPAAVPPAGKPEAAPSPPADGAAHPGAGNATEKAATPGDASIGREIHFVNGETGEPLPGIAARAQWLKPDEPGQQTKVLLSDAKGVVRAPMPRGRNGVAMTIVTPGWWTNQWITLAEAPGDGGAVAADVAEPVTVKLWRGTRVTGRLIKPDGSPMAGAALQVGVYINNQEWKKRLGMDLTFYSWDHGDWPNWSTGVLTKEDGTFEATVPPPDARSWVRVGTTHLSFGNIAPAARPDRSADAITNYVPFEAEARGPEDEKVGELSFGDLRLERGLILRGQVVDAEGNGLAGVRLMTSGARGPYAGRNTVSGADGRFAFLPMAPGSFTLSPDARLRGPDGQVDSRDVLAVFLSQPVTLQESKEITVRAVPHVELEFDWVDRRAQKGPVSFYGEFTITGRVPREEGEPARWRGETELVKRDGRDVLVVKVPRAIEQPTLSLPADKVVTASYEDPFVKSGSGQVVLQQIEAPFRRTIFGDEPRKR